MKIKIGNKFYIIKNIEFEMNGYATVIFLNNYGAEKKEEFDVTELKQAIIWES